MSPSSVHRPIYGQAKSGGKRLVRYYVSQKGIQQGYKNCPIKTINANYLDELVRAAVYAYLPRRAQDGIALAERAVQDHWIRRLSVGIVLGPDELLITLSQDQLEDLREHDWAQSQGQDQAGSISNCVYTPAVEVLSKRRQVRLKLGLQIKRLDGKRVLLSPEGHDLVRSPSPEPQPHIVKAIGTAYSWREMLINDRITAAELSDRVGIDRTRVHKLLRLTCLGPEILKRALVGELPSSTTLLHLIEAGRQLDWNAQYTYLGIDLPASMAV